MTVIASPSVPAGTEQSSAIGRYELLLELGRGGMAVLYLARAHGVGGFARLFAIKRILPHLTADPLFVEMFLEEGRIAARLSHPNLCSVFELGQDRGELFLVMEYLDGVPWEALAAAAPRDPRGADRCLALTAGVLAQACEGLHHAHTFHDVDGTAMPIVHRDVSPQNLFVSTDGVCRVLDFGVSKIATDHRRTRTGVRKGKLPYMAPEQISGEPVDARTDVWAIGVLLWEALTGERLFDRDTDFLIYQAITSAPIPSVNAAGGALGSAPGRPRITALGTVPGNAPRAVPGHPLGQGPDAPGSGAGNTARGRYPDAVDRIIARALSRDREQRYATARDLGRDLVEVAGEVGGAASREAIAGAVAALCGEQIAARKQAISSAVTRRSAAEAAAARDTAMAAGAAAPGSGTSSAAPGDAADTVSMAMRRDAIVVAPRRPKRWIAAAAGLAVIAGAITVISVVRGGALLDEKPSGPQAPTPAAASPSAVAAADRAGTTAQPPSPAADRAGTTAQPPSPPAAADRAGAAQPPSGAPSNATPPALPVRALSVVTTAPVAAAPDHASPTSRHSNSPRPATASTPHGMPVSHPRPHQRTDAPTTSEAAASTPSTRPAPTSARPVPIGSYAVDSEPYATIYIDDRKIGDTPLDRIALPAGTHQVRAVLADGRHRTFAIDIAPDRKTSSGMLTW